MEMTDKAVMAARGRALQDMSDLIEKLEPLPDEEFVAACRELAEAVHVAADERERARGEVSDGID